MMTNQMLQQHDHQQQMQSPQSIADYLAQLLKDRKQLAALPNVFTHLERLLDEGESMKLEWTFCWRFCLCVGDSVRVKNNFWEEMSDWERLRA